MANIGTRILQTFLGPIRSVCFGRFVVLSAFWMVASFAALFLFLAGAAGRVGLSLSHVKEQFEAAWQLYVPLCLCAGMILAGIHYLFLRIASRESRASFRVHEGWLTVVLIGCMVAAPGYAAWRYYREQQLRAICWGHPVWNGSDVEVLLAGKRYVELVRKMEDASHAFHAARLELGDRFVPFEQFSGAGWSYMLITLAAYHPEPFALNAPRAMVEFLCSSIDDGSGDGFDPPKSCEPLAREMIKSQVPIVRLSGLWWLGEYETFRREVEDRIRAGDTSFQSWKGLYP